MTEQELNKACEWLKEHWGDYYAPVEYRKLTDDFRKAMDYYIDTETSKQLSEEVTMEIVKQINPLFEKCLAKVNPETREEVRRNMDYANWTEKACRWLVEHSHDAAALGNITCTSVMTEGTLIEDFRKAMCAVIKDSLSTAETAVKESLTTVYDADYLQSKIDLHTKYMQEHGITSEQQLAELDEMRGMSEFTTNPWIKASDELPKEGEHILFAKSLCEGGTPYYETVYYPEPGITDGIDYWMPIPKLPKED